MQFSIPLVMQQMHYLFIYLFIGQQPAIFNTFSNATNALLIYLFIGQPPARCNFEQMEQVDGKTSDLINCLLH